jgi:hypothetical protein
MKQEIDAHVRQERHLDMSGTSDISCAHELFRLFFRQPSAKPAVLPISGLSTLSPIPPVLLSP